ncbi:MAG: hypothetical protein AAF717_22710 [Bacteroidota bacterium]
MPRPSTVKKTVTLRSDVFHRLEEQAHEENRNFSNMVETAALNYLKQNDSEF